MADVIEEKVDTATQTPDYKIDYSDERFTKVNSDKTAALDELEKTYSGMIGDSDKYYQDQINASKEWADKQTQLQQEQSDFAIEQIEQQKDQAQKDYTKEQSGAYVDWQKQSNRYGVEAERQASAGMSGTGFSESSQVSMYNTYQNRVATAREAYNRAVLNYDNAIKDARLQNNAALAEIAYNALQQQLELSLQGFQYKNSLVLEQANKKLEVENNYYNRYQDVLNQINQENALAEEIRQYNESMDWEKYQFNYKNKLGEFAPKKSSGGGGGSGGSSSKKSSSSLKITDSSSGSSSDSSADDYFNKLISSATTSTGKKTDYNTQNGQQTMKSNVNAEINAAVKAGAITKSEAKKLKETYAPRGYTY